MMQWLWTWGGACFGYRDGDDLWTYDGRHVGRFHGDEVYGSGGGYLGEIMNGDRLITHRSKQAWLQFPFAPLGRRRAYTRYMGYVGYTMYTGYEDFPDPKSLR